MLKKIKITFIIILFIFFLNNMAEAVLLTVEEKEGILYANSAWATEYNGLNVFYFTGTPEEIGQQKALFILKPEEEELLQVFAQMQADMKTGNFFLDLFRDFYARFKFIPAFKRHIPEEYLREMEGMIYAASDGKDRNINDFIIANASQDLGLVFACSAFAAWDEMTANGEMLVGRNLDHMGFMEFGKYQYLAFYNPEQGIPFVTLGYPSFIGLMHGMNQAGLVITMNYSLVVAEESSIDGLPLILMLRQVLQYANNIEEAIEMIKNTPRTVGLNILLASSQDRKAVVVETSANRLYVREVEKDENYIYATNNFRSEYMQEFQRGGWLSSKLRDQRFEELKLDYKGSLDMESAVKILRDKHDPNTPVGKAYVNGIQNSATMASMIFNPDTKEVWVSKRGGFLAAESPFLAFSAKEIWETGKVPGDVKKIIPTAELNKQAENWLKVRKAELAFYQGERQEGLELLEEILKEENKAEKPLLLAGVNNIQVNNIEKGIDYLLTLVNLDKIASANSLLQAYFWLGVVHDTVLNNRKQALIYYSKGVSIERIDASEYYMDMMLSGLKSPIKLIDGRFVKSE